MFDSYVSKIRVVAMDGDPQVMAEVAKATATLNIVLLPLRQRIQTLWQTLPLLPVRTMTMVDVMDAGLVKGPMVGAMLDSLGR